MTYIASNRYLSAPHQVEMTAFMNRSTDEILQMDKLSPQEMQELSTLITATTVRDKGFYALELQNITKIKDLDNSFMKTVIEMMQSGSISAESRVALKKSHMEVRQAKGDARTISAMRERNRGEREDLCDKFRQELLSMRINALPRQGVPAASGEPLKTRPKGRFWGMRSSNPYAVEEIDQ